MRRGRLVINADDFGRDAEVNRAVLEAFRLGLCSSATLMPNMPGFEEACGMIRDRGLSSRVGIHWVLRDGPPLTDSIRRFPRFCDAEGRLRFNRPGGWLPACRLSSWEAWAVAAELRAQVAACRRRGVPLTHLDSHYHIHTEWGVLKVLLGLALELKIRRIRISRNLGTSRGPAKRLYTAWVNKSLKRSRLAGTDWFGSVDDYRAAGPGEVIGSREVMVHPLYRDGCLTDDGGELLADRLSLFADRSAAVAFGEEAS